MKFEIKNRFTGAVLFTCELPPDIAAKPLGEQRGYALRAAVSARANLAGADLARANLAGADLAGANLAGADLARAYLAGANLAGADLARAYLAGANLARANLAGADLAGANLADADLADADLAGAYLAGAYLAGAYLARAYLAGADLARADLAGALNVPETNGSGSIQSATAKQERPPRKTDAERAADFRARNPDIPVIESLDAKILAAIEGGKGTLDMSTWHKCETTHCRAGWAITLAGKAGAELEEKYGPHHAGRLLYRAATGRVPHFFASNERALEDIREQAAKQS